jgi:hypothetical protein
MRRHLLRDFDAPAVFQIGRDAGGAKGVVADLGADAGRGRPAADHAIGIHLRKRPRRQLPRVPVHGLEQKGFGIVRQAGFPYILVEVLIELVMAGQLVHFAAFFVQPDPGPPPLHVHIFYPHLHGRAHPREGERHQTDQRAIPQADERAGFDGIEEIARFVAREDRRFSFFHRVLGPAHDGSRIPGKHLAKHEPIEEHAQRGQVLFDRRVRQRALQFFKVSCDMQRLQAAELVEATRFASGRKSFHGAQVGAACIRVADVRAEKLREPFRTHGKDSCWIVTQPV